MKQNLPSLDIIIPAYNEENRLGPTLQSLSELFYKKQFPVRIMIVLNGCTDNTEQLVQEYQNLYPNFIDYHCYLGKIGKGGATMEGFKLATSDLVSYADADGAVSAREILKLYLNMGKCDAIIGSRHLPQSRILKGRPLSRRIAGRTFNYLVRFILKLPFKDTQCGGKVFTKNVAKLIAQKCEMKGWDFDVNILLTITNHGYVVKEFPVDWVNDDRSKIQLLRDGYHMFRGLLTIAKKDKQRVQRGEKHFQNILMVQHHIFNQGTFLRCFRTAEFMANQKKHITILCTRKEVNKKNLPSFNLKDYQVDEEYDENNPYIKIVLFPRFHEGHSPWQILIRTVLTFAWLIRNRKFDLYHIFALGNPTNSIPSFFFHLFFFKQKKQKILVDWDDLWGNGFGHFTPAIINKSMLFFEQKMPFYLKAQAMTVVSTALKIKAFEMGFPLDKIHLLINGCYRLPVQSKQDRAQQKVELNLDPQYFYGCSVGHTYFQSLEHLLFAFSRALEKQPKLRLLMVGDFRKSGEFGTFLQKLEAKYTHLFQEKIILTGEVSYEKMCAYAQAADFVILPMQNDPLDCCRFPIRFGDYLSLGQHIVSNAVGEIKRIMETEKIGHVCPVDDLEKFAELMVTATEANHFHTQEEQRRLRNLAAGKYHWSQIAAEWEQLYDQLSPLTYQNQDQSQGQNQGQVQEIAKAKIQKRS